MLSAVDSSVLLDVVCNDPFYAARSEALLRQAATDGGLIVCEAVLAEIRPAFSAAAFQDFLRDWQLRFVPASLATATLAGEQFARYVQRGGRAPRVVADFLIGAHAVVQAERLLARDRSYLREYFPSLKVSPP